jgi:hypothetical protein
VVFNNLNYERSSMILDHFNRVLDAHAHAHTNTATAEEEGGEKKRGELYSMPTPQEVALKLTSLFIPHYLPSPSSSP